MYQLSIPTRIRTKIQLPASKSISNRALIINTLAKSKLVPENLSDCDDTRVMIKALQGHHEVIDIMAAGTSMRFLTAYLSITPGVHTITGTTRMQQRPIHVLVNALRSMGAEIEYIKSEGFPPLRITGKALTKNEISLPGNISSQYISALLMIAPVLPNGLKLSLKGEIISRPYINLTIQLMKEFGAVVDWNSEHDILIKPVPYTPTSYVIENDWSAASYWYQLAAFAEEAEITLPGLLPNSYQGDRRGAELFRKLGVDTSFTKDGVILTKNNSCVSRLEEDLVDIPDLAQTFVVTCALKNIPFYFSGLQSLKIKETDRIGALISELGKLGYILHQEKDSILYWNGERCEPQTTPEIKTYEDHRMAMAFAPAAMYVPQMRILEPEVVSKSYPLFWEDLKIAGVEISQLKR
ncbi:3-phosphoshikimate 1-carboxyvinyltransferase [Bacteroides sp. 214]|uniref:3-phosphoshikimate 1-carboxyvinyltransferase n=1 Tax=Bacteroides sp. 214 TaxID=2302935 RepID=UPI0013D5A321|nr:3-phosphoshikimate 1-carboxyvinyltransferase [Bacteroides sp. 214]NDW13662.1 3-phosphoshikimate 1-carboxyvinyltransferase [Bacteroides sp. 214]